MFDQIKIRPENPIFNYLCHCILNIIPNNIERHPIPIQNPFLMQLLDELRNDRFIVNLLHITSNLYNFDLSLVTKYLKLPPIQPEYRQQRPHEDFIQNIPMSRSDLIKTFKQNTTSDPIHHNQIN